jgi:acetoin utilization deacetylase AcuC-like enzyme
VEQGVAIPGSNVYTPKEVLPMEQLTLVHEVGYVKSFLEGTLDPAQTRRIGFGDAINCPKLIGRTQAEVAGTLLTAELALKHGLAVSTAGGTHHAFRAAGSGFCILNDLAVTSEILLQRGQVDRVLILDLDVHQGDGTAAIFQDRRDVFTLSVHAAQNFPSRKQHSHLDIALPDGTEDEAYLKVVSESLAKVLQSFKPSLVLYDAGVDTHKDDELGRLALTDQGIVRRERLVFDTCLGHDVPVAAVVGGGYSQDLNELARRHCFMHRAAFDMWNLYKL